MITVIDNYLSQKDFDGIEKVLLSNSFPWMYSSHVAHTADTKLGYFCHNFYYNGEPQSRFLTDGLLNPIFNRLKPQIPIRMKANLYPATAEVTPHEPHADLPYPHKACVFCINTCDGGTLIGERKIDSVANRMILFDASVMHQSTTCSDAPVRVNINMNWLDPNLDEVEHGNT